MSATLSQTQRILAALSPRDISSPVTGPYLDVSGAQRLLASVTTASVLATKTVTAQLMQAQDATGTNAKVLGTATVLTAPAGGAALAANIPAKIGDLDHNNGFGFVALQLSSNTGSPVYGAGVLILGGNRYNP